ncbi:MULTISPECIES: hypothetical protein [Nocardia]|uniref:DUF8175 domain-containing protein n=1 Tax=Nocardia africana TaxID=134964 RepID=A0A378WHA8_9NOCA|nr:hypothetical protein [Nocardia africana]MCC3317982.1 hypothetical protein [Nocardia africana]SUA40706.1 Uncharacterised protein [Nocardia africana]
MNIFRALSVAAVIVAAIAGCSQHQPRTVTTPPPVDLKAEPAGVVWSDYHGVELPAGVDGPRENRDAATGFSRTPAGAALAAIVHTVHMSIAPSSTWPAIARAELAPEDKDALVTSHSLLSVNSPADPATAPRIRGYTITRWSPDRTRVEIYTSFPDQSIAVNTAEVVWHSDWLLAVPAVSSTAPTVRSADRIDAAVRLEPPQ